MTWSLPHTGVFPPPLIMHSAILFLHSSCNEKKKISYVLDVDQLHTYQQVISRTRSSGFYLQNNNLSNVISETLQSYGFADFPRFSMDIFVQREKQARFMFDCNLIGTYGRLSELEAAYRKRTEHSGVKQRLLFRRLYITARALRAYGITKNPRRQ